MNLAELYGLVFFYNFTIVVFCIPQTSIHFHSFKELLLSYSNHVSWNEGKMLFSEEAPDLEGTSRGTQFPYHSQGSHSNFLLRNQQNLEIQHR